MIRTKYSVSGCQFLVGSSLIQAPKPRTISQGPRAQTTRPRFFRGAGSKAIEA